MKSRFLDVAVVGGGAAGIAAAVTAARSGATTALVERDGVLGGMAVNALVHSICGLYFIDPCHPPRLANPGFPAEFLHRLEREGAVSAPRLIGRVHVVFHDPHAFARAASRLVSETERLSSFLHSDCHILQLAGDESIEEIEIVGQGAAIRLRIRAVVDATGDAEIAAKISGGTEMAPVAMLQRPAFIFGIAGVTVDLNVPDARLATLRLIHRAVGEGRLPEAATGVSMRAALQRGGVYVTINFSREESAASANPCDRQTRSLLQRRGIGLAAALVKFLRAECRGFEDAALDALPERIGTRESRRMVGQYRLLADDIASGRTFPDAVALATWPMETWETATHARMQFARNDAACGIPLRALRSLVSPNLFAAGRCIACDHGAQASIRVIGTCLASGEAAGRAAAAYALGQSVAQIAGKP